MAPVEHFAGELGMNVACFVNMTLFDFDFYHYECRKISIFFLSNPI